MHNVGHAVLVLGPSGAGKSSLARSALLTEGAGAALLAPGVDELASYTELLGRPEYMVFSVDDPEWAPSVSKLKATGFQQAMGWMYERLAAPPPVLVVDTVSALAQLAVNHVMCRMGIREAPKAMSPEGAQYYTGIRNAMEDFMRLARACRAAGSTLLFTSHVAEKEQAATAMAGQISKTVHVPLIPGSYREVLPAAFDVVLHAGVNPASKDLRHYLQWVSDPKRVTKSRVGDLGPGQLQNNWPVLKQAIVQAIKARAAAVPTPTH
jgi:hypothetical protein